MLKSKRLPLPTYNDGVVSIYREKNQSHSFGAQRNVSTLEDMDFIVRLHYQELSMREQDFQFAEQRGFNLAMKIKTHNRKEVDSECKAVIGELIFDVSYPDRSSREMYLYLEGGRQLGT